MLIYNRLHDLYIRLTALSCTLPVPVLQHVSATHHRRHDTLKLTIPCQLLKRRMEIHTRRPQRKQPNGQETHGRHHPPRLHPRPRHRTQRRRQLVREKQDGHGQQEHVSRHVMPPAQSGYRTPRALGEHQRGCEQPWVRGGRELDFGEAVVVWDGKGGPRGECDGAFAA